MYLMLDLETLSTSPNAVVLSLGAVVFNETEIIRTQHILFDAQEQIDTYKRHVSIKTVAWWASQSPEARVVLNPTAEAMSVRGGLSMLSLMLAGSDWEKVRVWSNGAAFDLPILHTLHQNVMREAPWKFYNECCFRTVKELYKAVPKPERAHLVAHNAVDDAIHQVQHLQAIWKAVGVIK